MDGNPEGTPNPLNPVEGAASEPSPNTDAATGAGELDFIETAETTITAEDSPLGTVMDVSTEAKEEARPAEVTQPTKAVRPMEAQSFSAVDQYVTARPASFTEPVAKPVNTSEAMPQMKVAAPRPVHPNRPVIDPMMRPVTRPNPAAESAPTRAESNFSTFATSDEPADELSQNIEQVSSSESLVASDSVVEPAKKTSSKKRGLIIGAIVFIIIAIICASAAIAIFVLGNNDRVSKAIDKMLNGQVSSIVEAKGTISSTSSSVDDDDTEELPMTTVELDGTFDIASKMSKLEASLTSSYESGAEITLDINELTNKSGETFFKISGLDNILNTLTTSSATATVTGTEEGTSLVNSLVSLYTNLVKQLNDKWILATNGVGDVAENISFVNSSSLCIVSALETLPEYGKDIASKYKANPFITSSKDNLAIKNKRNELYRLGYNKEKMNAFVKSMSGNGFVKALNSCAANDADDVDSTLFEEIFANFPVLYVEVDNDNNFTRVYLTTTVEAGGISTSTNADLDFSYPSKLEVVEPSDYTDLSDVVLNLFTAQS